MGYSVARLLACVMLVVAMLPCDADYYTVLRVVVCAIGTYGVYLCYKKGKMGWAWCMGATAFLFNPILQVHLQRDSWGAIDALTSVFLLASLFFIQATPEHTRIARVVAYWAAIVGGVLVVLGIVALGTIAALRL